MTSPDHPVETVLWLNCTGCHRLSESRLLMPLVTNQERIVLLCGRCQWKMRPKESVCCVGEAGE